MAEVTGQEFMSKIKVKFQDFDCTVAALPTAHTLVTLLVALHTITSCNQIKSRIKYIFSGKLNMTYYTATCISDQKH